MKKLKKEFILSRISKLEAVSPSWYIKAPAENEYYYILDMRLGKLTWIEKELALLITSVQSLSHLMPHTSHDSAVSAKDENDDKTVVLPDPNFILSVDFSLNQLTFLKYTDLANFFELRQLIASFNNIVDISGISACSRLTHLCLSYNSIRSLHGAVLEQCKYLSHLDLRSNFINDLSDLPTLPSLRCLNLSYNQLQELNGLQNLFALQELYLQHNKIDSIMSLTACLELVALNLANNHLNDSVHVIDVLCHFRCLSELDINGNYFKDNLISSLQKCTKIKFFNGKLVGSMESSINLDNNLFSLFSQDLKSQLKSKAEKDMKKKKQTLESEHLEKLNYLYAKVLCLSEETNKELLETEENFAKWCIYVDNLSDKETAALVQKYLKDDETELPESVHSHTFSGLQSKPRVSDPKETSQLLMKVSKILSKDK